MLLDRLKIPKTPVVHDELQKEEDEESSQPEKEAEAEEKGEEEELEEKPVTVH